MTHLLAPLSQRDQCLMPQTTKVTSERRGSETREFHWRCQLYLPPDHGGHHLPPDDIATEITLFTKPPKETDR